MNQKAPHALIPQFPKAYRKLTLAREVMFWKLVNAWSVFKGLLSLRERLWRASAALLISLLKMGRFSAILAIFRLRSVDTNSEGVCCGGFSSLFLFFLACLTLRHLILIALKLKDLRHTLLLISWSLLETHPKNPLPLKTCLQELYGKHLKFCINWDFVENTNVGYR